MITLSLGNTIFLRNSTETQIDKPIDVGELQEMSKGKKYRKKYAASSTLAEYMVRCKEWVRIALL